MVRQREEIIKTDITQHEMTKRTNIRRWAKFRICKQNTMGQDAKEPVVVICVIYVFTFSSIMLIFKIQD